MRWTMKHLALQRFSQGISNDAGTRCVTEDIDEFQLSLDSVFYPSTIDLKCERDPLSHAELHAVRLKHLTIGLTRFGHDVSVEVGDLGSYHVNVPVSGHVVSWCGERHTIANPER